MGRRRDHQSFAEIVEQVKNSPQPPAPVYDAPGLHPDGTLVDADGRTYRQVSEEVSSARAFDLAARGAAVAWDSCGCGGYCGFTWYDREAVARMVAAGRPEIRRTKRARGSIAEWLGEDGGSLLLAEGAVRWGELLA